MEQTDDKIAAFEKGWAEEMVKIWREKIMHYNIRHTGALYKSVRVMSVLPRKHIMHTFLKYGIYVERGTGNGYKRDNDGQLGFMDDDYRARHKLGKRRKRRPWFNNRYYASIMKLNDVEGEIYGQAYNGLLSDCIRMMFEKDFRPENLSRSALGL